MTRIDELTLKLLDGELSPAEQAELDAVLASSPAEARRHIGLAILEGVLRSEGPVPDVASSTIAYLAISSGDCIASEVMRQVVVMPPPRWAEGSRRRAIRWAWRMSGIAAVAAVLLLLAVPLLRFRASPQDGPPQLIQASLGVLAGDAPADLGRALGPDEVISTPDDGFAVLQYPDGTRIDLFGDTRLRACTEAAGKRILLESGSLRAEVAPQPEGRAMILTTPTTELRVLGTRFDLTSLEQEGTRVDLESGRVELLAGQSHAVSLEAGSVAVVRPGKAPVVTRSAATAPARLLREFEVRGLRDLRFAADGTTLLGSTEWRTVTMRPSSDIEFTIINPTGVTLRAGYEYRGRSGSFHLYLDRPLRRLIQWDAEASRMHRIQAFEAEPGVVAFSPRGDWLALRETPFSKSIELFHLGNEHPLRIPWRGPINAAASSPDGSLLALGSTRRKIQIYNTTSGRLVDEFPVLRAGQEGPTDLVFTPQGRYLVGALTGDVGIWDVERRVVRDVLSVPGLPLRVVAVSPDATRIAASSGDGRVWTWNLSHHREPAVLAAPRCVRSLEFSSDGRRLGVLADHGQISVWEFTE
jgi:WD40 repeat protein